MLIASVARTEFVSSSRWSASARATSAGSRDNNKGNTVLQRSPAGMLALLLADPYDTCSHATLAFARRADCVWCALPGSRQHTSCVLRGHKRPRARGDRGPDDHGAGDRGPDEGCWGGGDGQGDRGRGDRGRRGRVDRGRGDRGTTNPSLPPATTVLVPPPSLLPPPSLPPPPSLAPPPSLPSPPPLPTPPSSRRLSNPHRCPTHVLHICRSPWRSLVRA